VSGRKEAIDILKDIRERIRAAVPQVYTASGGDRASVSALAQAAKELERLTSVPTPEPEPAPAKKPKERRQRPRLPDADRFIQLAPYFEDIDGRRWFGYIAQDGGVAVRPMFVEAAPFAPGAKATRVVTEEHGPMLFDRQMMEVRVNGRRFRYDGEGYFYDPKTFEPMTPARPRYRYELKKRALAALVRAAIPSCRGGRQR
jgi:hypothetical protein